MLINRRMNRVGLTIIFTLVILAIFIITGLFVLLIGFLAIHFGLLERFGLRMTFPVLLSAVVSSAIVGMLVSMTLGRIPLRPIRQLINAINRLAAGDFSARISIVQTEELRELSDSFNRMAKELGSIELLRSDFVNNFSHEFKTPIVSIKGFAELLKVEDLPPEERNEYMDIIIRESTRLATMATNVLNLSKVENQTIVTEKSPYDLSEQLRRCVLLMQTGWEHKNLHLDIDLQELTILANSEMLSQVWLNLLDNAIKFSKENGQITVTLRKAEGMAEITVRDDGLGIAQQDISHVFDKFYQSDASRAIPGNGLGLALAKKIVQLHGGEISCLSQEDHWTAFTVRLPLGTAESS